MALLMDDGLNEWLAAIAADDDERAEQAVGQLSPAALPALRTLLSAAERDSRWWATRALAALGTAEAVTLLLTALRDHDADVRACAVVGLAGLHPPQAIEPLVACLSDPSAYVGRLAADALAQFGQVAATALVTALQQGDAAARAGAARALVTIQPPEAISALCAALDDPSAIVTYYAEEALERMGVGMVFFRP